MEQEHEGNGLLGVVFAMAMSAGVIALLFVSTGCSALVGIKEWPTKNGPIRFVTGADFSIGGHGIDSIDDRRGIKPTEQEYKIMKATN